MLSAAAACPEADTVALEWLEVVLEAELSEEGEAGEPMDLPATWPALGSNSFSFMADILKRGEFVSLGFFWWGWGVCERTFLVGSGILAMSNYICCSKSAESVNQQIRVCVK